MKCPEVVNRQYKGELPEFTFSLKNIFHSLRIRVASRVPCKLLTDKQMPQIPFLLLALMFVWLLKRVVVKKKRGSIPGQLSLSAPINDPHMLLRHCYSWLSLRHIYWITKLSLSKPVNSI